MPKVIPKEHQPDNTAFIGCSGKDNNYTMFVSIMQDNVKKIYRKDNFNKVEIRYWYKSFWDGLLGGIEIPILIKETDLKLSKEPLPETTRVAGTSFNRTQVFSCTSEHGSIGNILLIQSGPSWQTNQSAKIEISKKVLFYDFDEPKETV